MKICKNNVAYSKLKRTNRQNYNDPQEEHWAQISRNIIGHFSVIKYFQCNKLRKHKKRNDQSHNDNASSKQFGQNEFRLILQI